MNVCVFLCVCVPVCAYLTDGAAERHLSITLGEVHVTHRQIGALHKDRKVNLASLSICMYVFIYSYMYMHV